MRILFQIIVSSIVFFLYSGCTHKQSVQLPSHNWKYVDLFPNGQEDINKHERLLECQKYIYGSWATKTREKCREICYNNLNAYLTEVKRVKARHICNKN